MKLTYQVHEVAPYINWIYFFHAWNFQPRFASIADIHGCDACRAGWLASFPEADRPKAAEAMQLHKEALRMLNFLDGKLSVEGLFTLFEANSEGDNLVIYRDNGNLGNHENLEVSVNHENLEVSGNHEGNLSEATFRFPLLRQQHTIHPEDPYLCLSDFVRPIETGIRDKVGFFATTVDTAPASPTTGNGSEDDPYRTMLIQTLADRLAEAGIEKMHQRIRTSPALWGYAPIEKLSIPDLLLEKFQGIRPAVGYPSLPDQSVNFLIDELLDFSRIGISLTENGMMHPHASVSGLMFAHPQARYFSVGKIGEDQLASYAERRGFTIEKAKKFLAANL